MGSTDQAEFPNDPLPDCSTGSNDDATSDLIKLARRAFEEKRLRDCLGLVTVILKMDSGNRHAQVLQSWIHADLQQEFQRALKLAGEARAGGDSGEVWRRVEIALRSVLDVLPDNEEAQALLVEACSSAPGLDAYPPAAFEPKKARKKNRWIAFVGMGLLLLALAAVGYSGFSTLENPLLDIRRLISTSSDGQGTLSVQVEEGLQVFVDGQDRGAAPIQPVMLPVGKHRLSYKSGGRIVEEEEIEIFSGRAAANTAGRDLGRVDLVVVPTTGVDLVVDDERIGPAPQFIHLKPGVHELSLSAEGYSTEVRKVAVNAGQRTLVPVLLQETNTTNAGTRQTNAGTRQAPPAAQQVDAASRSARNQTAPSPGRIPVTSPPQVAVNETTPVSVATDIVVAINADPWAEVFVNDGQITSLGQTPLNAVRVPVGSLLIFRHPGFSDKTHRILSRDTTISVIFR